MHMYMYAYIYIYISGCGHGPRGVQEGQAGRRAGRRAVILAIVLVVVAVIVTLVIVRVRIRVIVIVICSYIVILVIVIVVVLLLIIMVIIVRVRVRVIGACRARQGTNGVSADGVTVNFMFFDRGTFWLLPLTYFYVSKSASAYMFPQSVKIISFCSGSIIADRIGPQPKSSRLAQVIHFL